MLNVVIKLLPKLTIFDTCSNFPAPIIAEKYFRHWKLLKNFSGWQKSSCPPPLKIKRFSMFKHILFLDKRLQQEWTQSLKYEGHILYYGRWLERSELGTVRKKAGFPLSLLLAEEGGPTGVSQEKILRPRCKSEALERIWAEFRRDQGHDSASAKIEPYRSKSFVSIPIAYR